MNCHPTNSGCESKVLVVDDARVIREVAAKRLRNSGFDVATCENGQEACRLAFEYEPDVILMDLEMPVMDGLTAIRFLKSNLQTQHIPIVAFTSEADGQRRVQALQYGAHDVVSKDADDTEMVARVRNFVRLKDLEMEVLRERDKMTSILNDLVQPVVIVDNEYRVILANASARRLFQMPPELDGQLMLEQIVNRSAEASEFMRRVHDDNCDEAELSFGDRGHEGASEYVVRFGGVYSDPQTSLGMALVFHDVTQEREMERLKMSFHSMIAHDLRSPIAVITGYTDLLRNRMAGDLNDTQSEFVFAIEDRAKAMLKLVDEFLTVSKLEGSGVELESSSVDLNTVLKTSANPLQLIADRKNIELRYELDSDPLTVLADPDKLSKVFTNLIDNALKYTPDGGCVALRSERTDRWARVAIADTGIGIDAEELPYVFDRYRRMSTAKERRIKGTGLGLAIVQEIARAHGGEVTVTSVVDKGTTFTVSLPLSQELVPEEVS